MTLMVDDSADALLAFCTMGDDVNKQIHPIHPLLIDHVVESVLQIVDPELLGHYCKIFRLVCKDWFRIATKVYKTKRGRITFKKNFIGRVSGLFIRVMKTSADIPFEKFRFGTDSYDNENFDELLHVCSGAITTLELNVVNPCDLRFPKKFPNLILGRLKSLVFHVRIENMGYLQLEMASLFEALLDSGPNIESLDLKVFGGMPRSLENAHHHATITRKIGDVISRKPPSKLRHLKLKMTLSDDQLKCLTKHKLKIHSLDVYFQQSQFRKETMEEFLSAIAPTLVRCKALGNQFLMDINFPVFPKVRHLVTLGEAPFSIKYEKIFPSLDKLEMCLWDDQSSSLGFDVDTCFSKSLTHVEFPFVVSNPNVYHVMGRCFPNLKKLTGVTIQTSAGMKVIFKSLLTLEVLEVTLGSEFHELLSTDSVFTGVPDDACSFMIRFKEFQENTLIENWSQTESVRNLKELKSLSIATSPLKLASNVRLTDITVYYGFLHLKNLVKIHLDYFPISTNAMEKLKKKVYVTQP